MTTVGSPPEMRGSSGSPGRPNCFSALSLPSPGGFFPASVFEYPNRASNSDVPFGVHVAPKTACRLRA